MQEWAMLWPADPELRRPMKKATLYVTLEPSHIRHGTAVPPVTSLMRQVGIRCVVIPITSLIRPVVICRVGMGCPNPVPEYWCKGATGLHNADIQVVTLGKLDNDLTRSSFTL